MVQEALSYFFIIVASTLGFITAYSQIDSSARAGNAVKRNLDPISRELPVVIYISVLLIALRVINTRGFMTPLFWVFVNLQVIILVYSNFLLPSVRSFLVVQLVGAICFGTSGLMNGFSWVFLFLSGLMVFAERWYGPHFKRYEFTYLLPAIVIGVIFWVMIAMRFPQAVSPEFAGVNLFSYCWAYFALERYDQDQHEDQRIIAKLTHETQYDGLTQVRNWSTFQEDFNTTFHTTGDVSLITLDIDHFKAINDTYGHLVGNQALMVVSSNLSKYLEAEHPDAHLYRTGGEEFAIILPQTDCKAATEIVLTCQKRLRAAQIRYSQGEFYLSASFGLATASDPKKGYATAMFKRADHYLYQSKHRGRNCVTVEGQTMTAMQN